MLSDVAVVAIGRNEGDRLRKCLDSVVGVAACVVYVDSGSSDDSVAMATAKGVHVVALDPNTAFTAARARNAGAASLRCHSQTLNYIQFVDGDCEVAEGWLAQSQAFLERRGNVAAVFGRRRERYPDRSVFNRLCDLEWNVRPGDVRHFGGDVMLRAAAYWQVGGYRDDLIAGEEPELSVRLRAARWQIHCLDMPMTTHDAAITHWRQWWRRAKRSGYAFAQGAHLHGAPPERHWVRETRRAWLWGLLMPLAILSLAWTVGPVGLLFVAVYPLQMLRLYVRGSGSKRERALKAVFHTLSRFPEVAGQLLCEWDRLMRRRGKLIEYK